MASRETRHIIPIAPTERLATRKLMFLLQFFFFLPISSQRRVRVKFPRAVTYEPPYLPVHFKLPP